MSKETFKTNDRRKWYREEYLKSDHWKKLRARKLRKNPICEICEKRKAVEPHHIRYRRIFDVTLKDLLSACRKCHTEEHRRMDSNKQGATEKKRLKKERSARHHAASEALGRPPRFPVMRDRFGLPVVTVVVLAKKNDNIRRALEAALGTPDIVGIAVPYSVIDSLKIAVT